MIARNRAVYDVLVLLLCYPEKRTSDLEGVISVHVDEDDEASDASSELQESYNVRNGRESLPDLLRSASKTHHAAAPPAHHPVDHRGHHVPHRSSSNQATRTRTGKRATCCACCCATCCTSTATTRSTSLSSVYGCLPSPTQELQNDQLIHCIMMFLKVSPNPYIFKLLEVVFPSFFHTANPVPHLCHGNPCGARQLHPLWAPGRQLRSDQPSVRCRWTASSWRSLPRSTATRLFISCFSSSNSTDISPPLRNSVLLWTLAFT